MAVFRCELEQTAVNRRIVVRLDANEVRANRLEDDSAASLTTENNGVINHAPHAPGTLPQAAFVAIDQIVPNHLQSVATFVRSFLDRDFDL
jgi:hypothetical protein